MKIVTARGSSALHAPGALGLELEQRHVPLRADALELRAERAVAVPGDVDDVLEEGARLDPREELVRVEEPVLASVHLAGPAVAGRRGDGHLQLGHALQQLPDQRSLAGTGRPGHDDDRRPGATG